MRQKIIFLICLLYSFLQAKSTNFILKTSQNVQSPPIPIVKQHPFSCQLIAFSVIDENLTITIEDFPKDMTKLNLTVDGEMDEMKIKNTITGDVDNETQSVEFTVQFNKSVMSVIKGKEIVLNFNLTNGMQKDGFSQVRKVFIIYHTKGNQTGYHIQLPIASIIITQIIGIIFTIILPLNVQYRKFKPFTFNIVSASIYMFILFLVLYIGQIFPVYEEIYLFQRIMISIISFICVALYSQDLLSYLCDRTTLITVIALILTSAVIFAEELCPLLQGAFFLNDLIAFMVAGTYVKFIVIRKIKVSIWAIILMWFFFALRQFAIQIRILNFDQGISIRIIPLFLQIPNIQNDPNSYICSAFGSSKIIAMGVILNYSKRVDLYLSTHFYRVLTNLLAICCLLIELVYNLTTQFDVPTLQFLSVILFYPVSLFFLLFFANKRGEWAEIWHGSFYDIAVNRGSIVRSVNFEEVEENFGKDLLINKNTISDRSSS